MTISRNGRTLARKSALVAGAAGLTVIAAAVALTFTSSAAYVDTANARSDSVAAAVIPAFQPGLSKNSRMVDTGVGLGNDGNVYVWGRTDLDINGGAANPGVQRAPQKVPLPDGATKQIASGIYNINALDVDGNVWGWGTIPARDGTDAAKPNGNPQRIRIGTPWNGAGPVLDDILVIGSTEQAGAGIRADGTVWIWGENTGYGGNTGNGASQLTGLPDPTVAGNRPVYIKGAYTSFVVILENGDVYYWGGTGGSSLPGGAANAGSNAVLLTQLNPWMKRNVAAGGAHIVAVDGGISMGAALLSDGRVVSWGGNSTRTGRGGVTPTTPALIPTLSGITSMQFGFTGAVFMDNQKRMWGYGASDDYGQLPLVPIIVDTNVDQYAAGQGYYIWERADGTFWGRGYNPQGAIGTPIGTQTLNRQVNWNLGMLAQ